MRFKLNKCWCSVLMLLFLALVVIYPSDFNIIDDDFTNNRVLIIVLTTEKSILTLGHALWFTWGKENKHIVFACNCENIKRTQELIKNGEEVPLGLVIYEKVAHLPILYLNNIEEDYRKMGAKVFATLESAYKIYNKLVDWYFMVDDDTFVFTKNLVDFTNERKSSEALVYGFKWETQVTLGYIGGGGGILFTRESMQRLYNAIGNHSCDQHIRPHGDISIGKCAYSIGIRTGDSNDEYGRQRFLPDSPKTHFYGPLPLPYSAPGTHSGKIGKECCSLTTISFHYVTADEMHAIHANKTYLKDMLS